jgi:hypothetical protein
MAIYKLRLFQTASGKFGVTFAGEVSVFDTKPEAEQFARQIRVQYQDVGESLASYISKHIVLPAEPVPPPEEEKPPVRVRRKLRHVEPLG